MVSLPIGNIVAQQHGPLVVRFPKSKTRNPSTQTLDCESMAISFPYVKSVQYHIAASYVHHSHLSASKAVVLDSRSDCSLGRAGGQGEKRRDAAFKRGSVEA